MSKLREQRTSPGSGKFLPYDPKIYLQSLTTAQREYPWVQAKVGCGMTLTRRGHPKGKLSERPETTDRGWVRVRVFSYDVQNTRTTDKSRIR